MSEYFQGFPVVRQWLGYEFDKSLAEARGKQDRLTQAEAATQREHLENLSHQHRVTEIITEHIQNRADIGTRGDWDRILQEAKLQWQGEENAKSRKHEAEQREKDRETDITVARYNVGGRIIPLIFKSFRIKGDDKGDKSDKSAGTGTPKPGTVEYLNSLFDDSKVVDPKEPLVKSKDQLQTKPLSDLSAWEKFKVMTSLPFVAGKAVVETIDSDRPNVNSMDAAGAVAGGVVITTLLKSIPVL